jgi:hypothetical protein
LLFFALADLAKASLLFRPNSDKLEMRSFKFHQEEIGQTTTQVAVAVCGVSFSCQVWSGEGKLKMFFFLWFGMAWPLPIESFTKMKPS